MVSQALCQKGKEVINMLDQLKELLEMQRVLDDAILTEHGEIYNEEIAENIKIALFVELGEMMNELPTKFKHWKSTAKDNREKALEEYVDALHFALSLFNHYQMEQAFDYNASKPKSYQSLYCIIASLITELEYDEASYVLLYLFKIGNYLGFTWEEIYNAYKAKNAVNYERLRNGY